jgi:LmbE family N-acetylglucosaminyl deacetylase
MKILYIFPHPDDESFGPASAISKQRRQGHSVYLLTLTRGGATKQRLRYGYSIEKMGEIRSREMECVSSILDLTDLRILDFPDNNLKEMDPRLIEDSIYDEINRVQPHVLVTYPVHGISGFPDHLVTHAAVKRVFSDIKATHRVLRRLAFFTITENMAKLHRSIPLRGSPGEDIDCIIKVNDEDTRRANQSLDCYKTFQEVIVNSGIRDFITRDVYFEIFSENHHPPLDDLFNSMG